MAQLKDFVSQVPTLAPDQPIDDVADLMLGESLFLSMPVIADGKPVGSISRYTLQDIFMRRYGRELWGKKPISVLMNADPIIIDADFPLENAVKQIVDQVKSVLIEDFIITEQGNYIGMGSVIAVLRAMENRLSSRNTQLVQAYGRLKSSQTQLVQAEKMSSLGQMVAGVAHEINTPLGYVRGNIEIAKEVLEMQGQILGDYARLFEVMENGEDQDSVPELYSSLTNRAATLRDLYPSEEIFKLLQDTLHGVGHMAEIVSSLKDFSRLDQVPVENVDINACLDSTLLIAHNHIKNRIAVVKQYGDLPRVTCRPSQVNQVLLNLITNAGQAIQGEGQIRLTTWADESYVHAAVEDSGSGIEADKLKKIFEPFYTTKPVGKGTGLGLSVAYNIIREHKGRIKVSSRPGVGTTFTVSLPLAAGATGA